MNILRCQVQISRIVQVDIPAEIVGDQPTSALAELTARQQYGYELEAKTLSITGMSVKDSGLCTLCGGAKWTHRVRNHAYSAAPEKEAP